MMGMTPLGGLEWRALDLASSFCPLPALGEASSVGLVITLLVVGFAFLGAELFVIPGFGVAGVVGGASVIIGVVLSWSRFGAIWGMSLTLGSLALLGLGIFVLFRTRAGKRLMLETSLADAHAVPDDSHLVGQQGVAVTPLRPAGSAEIDGDRVDAETDGEFIEKGAPVRVVDMRLGRVVVEVAPAGDGPESIEH